MMVDGRTALAFPTTATSACGLSRAWFSNAGVVYAIPTDDDTILYTVWSDGGDWPSNEFPDQLVRSIVFR